MCKAKGGKMEIAILTEGGKNIGFGHIARCLSLYQAFEEKGLMSKMIVNGDRDARFLLKGRNYKLLDWLKREVELFKSINDAKIIIIDSYLADRSFYKKLSQITNTLVCIDDNNRINYPEGIILNGSLYADRLNYSQKASSKYLLGPKYILLRKEYWTFPQKKIRKGLKKVLVTLGGTGKDRPGQRIIAFVKNYLKDVQVCIIKGSCEPSMFRDLILDADICISAGGQTIHELAATGTPAISLCLADNQVNNLKYWSKIGFVENIGWYNNRHLEKKASKAFALLTDYSIRAKKSRIGRKIVDGHGAQRVGLEILRYYEKYKDQ